MYRIKSFTPPSLPTPIYLRNVGWNELEIGETRTLPNPQFLRIVVSVLGEVCVELKRRKVMCSQGHLFFIDAGRESMVLRAPSGRWEGYTLTCDGTSAIPLLKAMGLEGLWTLEADSEDMVWFESLFQNAQPGDPRSDELAVQCYARFLYWRRKVQSLNLSWRIEKAVAFIHQSLTMTTLSVESLSRELKVDRSYLSRQFKREMGISPMEYIVRQRLERALHQLSESSEPVSAVAESCGFSSVPHFSRLFKKHMGVSPKDVRSVER